MAFYFTTASEESNLTGVYLLGNGSYISSLEICVMTIQFQTFSIIACQMYVAKIWGQAQPVLGLLQKRGQVPLDYQKGCAGDHATSLNKSHVG